MGKNPNDIDAQLIAEWRRTGKVRSRDVVRVLDTIQLYHLVCGRPPRKYQSPNDILVPTELLDICGSLIAGKVAWAKACNARARRAGAQRRKGYQEAANRIWAKRPDLSASAVAKSIAKDLEVNWNTVRRRIRKP
jgi:hypothetical protein